MKIQVDLDPVMVKAIRRAARARGVSPGDIVRKALAPGAPATRVRIREMHADGWPDAVIARELGLTNGHVATVRRGMGLPANRRYTRKGEGL